MATLTKGIKLSDLTSASPEERKRQVDRLFQDALSPTEDQEKRQMDEIDARIKDFERQYEMPSAVMQELLLEGKIRETAEVCSWLMLLKLRGRFDTYRNQASAK